MQGQLTQVQLWNQLTTDDLRMIRFCVSQICAEIQADEASSEVCQVPHFKVIERPNKSFEDEWEFGANLYKLQQLNTKIVRIMSSPQDERKS